MLGIAGKLLRTASAGRPTAARSAQLIECILEIGLVSENGDAVLRASSLGTLGYRWAAEQAIANLGFGIRLAASSDPFTTIRLQWEYASEAWARSTNFVAGIARFSPEAAGSAG